MPSVFFGSSDGVHAVSTQTGEQRWMVDNMLTKGNGILNITVHGNTAYMGTGSGAFYAVDLTQRE